jgi:hypothetical protein
VHSTALLSHVKNLANRANSPQIFYSPRNLAPLSFFLTATIMPVSSTHSLQIPINTNTPKPAHNPHRAPHLGKNPPRKAAPNLPPLAHLLLTQHLSLLPPARTPNLRPHTLHPPQCLQPRNQKPTRALEQRLRKRRTSEHIRSGKTSA